MEWKAGLLLRIRNYRFEDDQSFKDKYAIVLFVNDDNAYLIHSLTTSQNSRNFPAGNYGCSVHQGIPYFIPQNQVIGDEAYFFDRDTFIFFGNNVRKEPINKFDAASKTLFGIATLGVLSTDELKRILKCALKSRYLVLEVQRDLLAYKDIL